MSVGLLDVLRNDESSGSSHIARADESWFAYHYESIHCDAKSHEVVPTRTKPTIATKKAMVTIFFIGLKLLIFDILPRECKFNQDSFLAFIAPELSNENAIAKRRLDSEQLVVHMDNSMCHNGGKIQQDFAREKMTRLRHPVDSPDLSRCDFWLFEYAKE
jgi:hypothetical protein